jgi:hypothetical protein
MDSIERLFGIVGDRILHHIGGHRDGVGADKGPKHDHIQGERVPRIFCEIVSLQRDHMVHPCPDLIQYLINGGIDSLARGYGKGEKGLRVGDDNGLLVALVQDSHGLQGFKANQHIGLTIGHNGTGDTSQQDGGFHNAASLGHAVYLADYDRYPQGEGAQT